MMRHHRPAASRPGVAAVAEARRGAACTGPRLRAVTPRLALSLLSLLSLLVFGTADALAQPTPAGGIYTCVGPNGKPITSDREIVGCVGDQVERNRDGSFKRIVPRSLNEDEKSAEDERKRRAEREATERRIEQRKDEDLLRRYPDVAALEKARQVAVAPSLAAIKISDERNQDLLKERRRLDDEAEFYPSKKFPAKLKNDFDRNDAALAAEKQAQQLRQDELKRNNDNFDAILARLKFLWSRQTSRTK
jgi:hypothetical protein